MKDSDQNFTIFRSLIPTDPGWTTVCGGFLIQMVLGSVYIWANITSAVTSYLRQFQPDLTYNETIIIFAGALAGHGSTMALGGVISQRIGPKLGCFLGSSVLISGTLLAAFSTSFVEMFLCEGLMLGIGLGLCHTGPISAAVKWMPDKKGFVTGIIVSGFGLGGLVFGSISSLTVNPNHVSVDSSGQYEGYFPPDSEVVQRVPLMFLVLTTAYTLFLGIGCSLLSEPPLDHQNLIKPTDYQVAPLTEDEETSQELVKDISSSSNQTLRKQLTAVSNLSPSEVIKRATAWHVGSCFISTAVGGMYLSGTYKTYAQQYIHNEAILSFVSSSSSICNTSGRFFWGWVADRIGAFRSMQLMAFFFSFTIGSFAWSTEYLGPVGFGLWTYLMFFFEGANFVLYIVIVVELFGTKYSGSNFGMIFFMYTIFVVSNFFVMSQVAKPDFEEASLSLGILTFVGFLNLILLELHVRRTS